MKETGCFDNDNKTSNPSCFEEKTPNLSEKIKLLYQCFLEVFKEIIHEIKDVSTHMQERKHFFFLEPEKNIHYTICNFLVQMQYNKCWYVVWYMRWKWVNEDHRSYKRNLLYIEPVKSTIQSTGLNSEFVTSGILIEKNVRVP